jgi:2-dehydropantoate 2-reductase
MALNMEKKKILVIGLGPCGGIIAAHLAANGHWLYGVDAWEKHAVTIRQDGLRIENLVSLHARFREITTGLGGVPKTDVAYAVVAVKTPDLRQVLLALKKFPGSYKIVLAQNGIDVEDQAADLFSRDRLLRMVLYYGGNIVSPGEIRMNFFQKPNYVGCLCGKSGCGHADEFARMMRGSALETDAVSDIEKHAWKKSILNAVLAPIAAVLGATMADVLHIDATRNLVEALLRESIHVGLAAGYDFGSDFPAACLNFLLQAGHHKPSMLSDLENGDPTEIDHINGKIVEYAKKMAVPAPLNAALVALVKARERLNTLNNGHSGKK